MIKRLPINIEEIEKFYRIEEDGSVYSLTKNRYLKAIPNSAGYLHVCLHLYMPFKFFLVHRVVAAKYNGPCSPEHDACHDDGNKLNNYYSNIIYRTHSQNILQSYREHGRTVPVFDRMPFSYQTKQLMAEAKKKPVLFIFNGTETVFPSIEIATKELFTYRKKIYNCITQGKEFVNKRYQIQGTLTFAPAVSPE